MKYLRTLLVTAMTALFIVGLAYAVTQTGFFGLKPQAAYARDYSPESLLNVPLLKEMIYSTAAEKNPKAKVVRPIYETTTDYDITTTSER